MLRTKIAFPQRKESDGPGNRDSRQHWDVAIDVSSGVALKTFGGGQLGVVVDDTDSMVEREGSPEEKLAESLF